VVLEKLGAGVLYNKLSIKRQFREKRFFLSHFSLKGVNVFLPAISVVLAIVWQSTSAIYVTASLRHSSNFRKIGAAAAILI